MSEKKPDNNLQNQSNFKMALQELLGNKFKEDIKHKDEIKPKEESIHLPEIEEAEPEVPETARVMPEISLKKQPLHNYSGGGTVITDDVVVDGSISSKSDIRLNCIVNGNVTSEAKIFIAGTIEGDVKGSSIALNNAHVKGNIICQDDISMDQSSVLIGDVKCQRLDSNGKIEGSVDAVLAVTLRNESKLLGNLSAQSLVVQEGAVINGNINIKRDNRNVPEI
ncbi:MAG: polymer-forming cytoskeletal protein [Clostridia bacterium]|jgi:cytoskeletal protein CcmA (bactofilin family)|nr:polymer-forming cytoskeletal protein [Clostridia bacterium]